MQGQSTKLIDYRERYGQWVIDQQVYSAIGSTVYKAHHHINVDDIAALKIIPAEPPDFAQSDPGDQTARRITNELEALQMVDHPNIVRLRDFGRDTESYWLAMQWVAGGTLAHRLDGLSQRRLHPMYACAYTIQIALALQAIHNQHLIHRDVKPSNILIDGDDPDHLYLADFGIVRSDYGTRVTADGKIIGTAEYMAPEQARNDPQTGRTDLYALGCVLFEMLSGRPPYCDAKPMVVASQQALAAVRDVRQFAPHIPDSLANIVHTLLAKDPDDRYPTGGALAWKLAPFLEGSTQTAWLNRVTGQLASLA